MYNQLNQFDTKRILDIPEKPVNLGEVTETTITLSAAKEKGLVNEHDLMLVTDSYDFPLAFPMQMLVAHGTAQGTINGKPWLATFCTICNAGGNFDPVVNGSVHTFAGNGVYDGMLLLRDKESNSRWNHINGQCLNGEHEGQALQKLSALHYIDVAQTLEQYPDAHFAVPQDGQEEFSLKSIEARLQESLDLCAVDAINATFDVVDGRRNKLEMGLGVWTNNIHRFYPLTRIFDAHNVIVDKLDDRTVVVYVEPETSVPLAFFIDTDSAEWQDDILNLSNGASIRNTIYYSADGEAKREDYPFQLFARWFSFSLTFPSTEVYGE